MNQSFEQIKPETIALIESQAKQAGLSVDEYLRSLIPHKNGTQTPLHETASPQELANSYLEWADSHDPGIPPIPLEAAEVTHEAADSWIYHAKDAATGAVVASPAPRGGSAGLSMSATSRDGTSGKLKIG